MYDYIVEDYNLKFKENDLKLYAAPLSKTENQLCLNAITMVRDALKIIGMTDDNVPIKKQYENTNSYSVSMRNVTTGKSVKIFLQGSYANNTNVRNESDVDIAIVEEDTFRTEYRTTGTYKQSHDNYGFSVAESTPQTFKDEIQQCLVLRFGKDVERKNKSIKVHGNFYRKDADTVPCRRYRDYRNDYANDSENYIGGIVIYPDDGGEIVNYPEQHIHNGVTKNNNTKFYYKKMVRIIKKIRYLMQDCGVQSSQMVSSFGLESLLWNIPDEIFKKYSIYRYLFSEVVDYLFENKDKLALFKEANGIKPLCSSTIDVDNYTKFIDDLHAFYEYDITE